MEVTQKNFEAISALFHLNPASSTVGFFYFIKMENFELLQELKKILAEKNNCILSDDQIELIADLFMNDYKDYNFDDPDVKWHISHAYIRGIKFAIKFINYK